MPVRELMREMVAEKNLRPGDVLSRQAVRDWFNQRYPLVKLGTIYGHLVLLSTNHASRVHHRVTPADDLFFSTPDGVRLYDPQRDPPPIYPPGPDVEVVEPDERAGLTPPELSDQFAYERDLQNYLAKNLDAIEPGLTLYEEEGIRGIEFDADGRRIDILARDRDGGLVVIELKVSKGHDRVVGQLMYYLAWVKENEAEAGQRVRGVIVAREISKELRLACSLLPDVMLFEYQISVALKRVEPADGRS